MWVYEIYCEMYEVGRTILMLFEANTKVKNRMKLLHLDYLSRPTEYIIVVEVTKVLRVILQPVLLAQRIRYEGK